MRDSHASQYSWPAQRGSCGIRHVRAATFLLAKCECCTFSVLDKCRGRTAVSPDTATTAPKGETSRPLSGNVVISSLGVAC